MDHSKKMGRPKREREETGERATISLRGNEGKFSVPGH